MTKDEIEQRLQRDFDALPPKLQQAAHYVLACPAAIAMDSMRSSAVSAEVQPAVMLRLARYLGFENYESFRDCYRSWVANPAESIYKRAEALTRRAGDQQRQKLLEEILETSARNLSSALTGDNAESLERAKTLIMQARKNYVLGLRSLFPAAYYLHYACATLYDNFRLLTDLGSTLVDELRRIDEHDAIVIFSFYPYSVLGAQVAEFARERKASIIAVTDSVVSPVARGATEVVLMSTNSPSMFPSILPAMACAEALAALLVASQQKEGLEQVEDLKAQLSRFRVFRNN